jgi:hypothetical protein
MKLTVIMESNDSQDLVKTSKACFIQNSRESFYGTESNIQLPEYTLNPSPTNSSIPEVD